MRQGTEFSFQTLAFNRRLSEALTKVVLRAVATAMSTVADYGDGHPLVLFVVCEDFLESLSQSMELRVTDGSRLKDTGFDQDDLGVGRVNAL